MRPAWDILADGVRVTVRLTPKADRDAIGGLREAPDGEAVEARVRAVPEDGKANAALAKLLSAALDVPVSALSLERGGNTRLKVWRVTGDPETLDAALRRLTDL